jgi:hypothetical protein
MMAKLATNAIGGRRSCESRKSGSTAGEIRVPARICGGRLRTVVCDPSLSALAPFCDRCSSWTARIYGILFNNPLPKKIYQA